MAEGEGMSFMEEYRALEAAVKDFDQRCVDLTTISDADLNDLEDSRLPLYRLHMQAYEERLRRLEIRAEERAREQRRLMAWYGCHLPGEDELCD
jgi:hypothetical protein